MGLKVIGAGLPRTGTLSLKFALERLGFGRSYHMTEFILNPQHAALWANAMNGAPDWDRLFQGYQATADFPGCFFWRELAEHYPDAKIVLGMRPPNCWYESLSQTVGKESHRAALSASPLGAVLERMRARGGITQAREPMIRAYERHVEMVRSEVPADRLLLFESRQGWGPLCEFLGLPVPLEAYPHVNGRAEARAMVGDDDHAASYEQVRDHYRAMFAKAA